MPIAAALLIGRGLMAVEDVLSFRVAAGLIAEDDTEDILSRVREQPEIHIPVSSSAIREIGYRPDNTISVTFIRGGTYTYDGNLGLFMAFVAAPSKGEFFNAHFQVRR